jgi:hypothetical protein
VVTTFHHMACTMDHNHAAPCILVQPMHLSVTHMQRCVSMHRGDTKARQCKTGGGAAGGGWHLTWLLSCAIWAACPFSRPTAAESLAPCAFFNSPATFLSNCAAARGKVHARFPHVAKRVATLPEKANPSQNGIQGTRLPPAPPPHPTSTQLSW